MTDHIRSCAERYGSVAQWYGQFWAPVMRALSAPLIDALAIRSGDRVLDLGCGVGTIGAQLIARGADVVGLDATPGMLSFACAEGLDSVCADMQRPPLQSRAFVGVISTFALQHAARAERAISEAARILAPGGFFGSATWGVDHAERGGIYDVLEEVFAKHGVPPEPQTFTTWHDRVNSPEKMTRFAERAGLRVERAHLERMPYRWSIDGFMGWVSTMGPYGRRLAQIKALDRERVLDDAEEALRALSVEAFDWTPEIVFLLAIKT